MGAIFSKKQAVQLEEVKIDYGMSEIEYKEYLEDLKLVDADPKIVTL